MQINDEDVQITDFDTDFSFEAPTMAQPKPNELPALPQTEVSIPAIMRRWFEPHRYKVAYGGRGSGKSWTAARILLMMAASKPLRVLCAREVQKSIKESVHTLLNDQIQALGLGPFYTVTEHEIRGANGSTFRFTGLSTMSAEAMKSFEGVDIVWCEEAASIKKRSWEVLLPTIRKPKSEIWITFNPDLDTDETYKRFVTNPPPDCLIARVNWSDNKWFPEVLERERLHCQRVNPKDYPNIWEGRPKSVVDGAIYATEYSIMVEEDRITRVAHDPMLKAHAIFDLGWNDAMSIIVVQRAGSELRILDYIEDSHQTLDWYSAKLKSLGYNWGSIWLPHDGLTKDYKTGKSAMEIMQTFDWNVEIIPVGDVEHGIRLGRMLFPRLWMDKTRTVGLQECLKRYRRRVNQQTGQPEGPMHDEYSHGADAFRYLATCVDMLRNEAAGKRRRQEVGYNGQTRDGAWMR